jgi:hypothetical protein
MRTHLHLNIAWETFKENTVAFRCAYYTFVHELLHDFAKHAIIHAELVAPCHGFVRVLLRDRL